MKYRMFSLPGLAALILFASSLGAHAADKNKIPEPFKGDSPSSDYSIDYSDIDALYKSAVLNAGRSTRAKAEKSQAAIGSRIRVSINRLTADEANRFYFEIFDTPEKRSVVTGIRESLEKLPSEAPLRAFTKSEQLAYWLNLYNITVIDEILKIYPESDLEDYFEEDGDIVDEKILNVAGVPLSLNDIHHKILMPKFDNNPLIIYGLYQGYIGGPNIRRQAYTGKNVFRYLKDNAYEFVNSNRGTYYDDSREEFRISELYERNEDYFPNFKTDVKEHIYSYLSGDLKDTLAATRKVRANINNWSIADLYGSARDMTSSTSTNSAALLGAGQSNDSALPDFLKGSGIFSTGVLENTMVKLKLDYGRFTPEQTARLKALDQRRLNDPGNVTVTDLESGEDKPKKEDK